MCRYACECRHPNCPQSPDGCFILGWPCAKHKNLQNWGFSENDIRSRDADWIKAGEIGKALSETEASDSKALHYFLHNKFQRLAQGTKYDMPQNFHKWLASQGLMSRPRTDKWRDAEFETFCKELGEYYRILGLNPAQPKARNAERLEEAERRLRDGDEDDEEAATTIAEEFQKPPAWKPSQSEVSLLLKTPPASPTEETETADPFQKRERHDLYSVEDLLAFESLDYLPLKPTPSGLDKLDATGYGLDTTTFLANEGLSVIDSESDEQDSTVLEEELENLTFIPPPAIMSNPAKNTEIANSGLEKIACLAPGAVDAYLAPPAITAPAHGLRRPTRTYSQLGDGSDSEDEDEEMLRFGGPFSRPGVSRRGPYHASSEAPDPDSVEQHDIFMRLAEDSP